LVYSSNGCEAVFANRSAPQERPLRHRAEPMECCAESAAFRRLYHKSMEWGTALSGSFVKNLKKIPLQRMDIGEK